MITLDKTYKTVSGLKVKLENIHPYGLYTIVGTIETLGFREWTKEGKYLAGETHQLDLVEVEGK